MKKSLNNLLQGFCMLAFGILIKLCMPLLITGRYEVNAYGPTAFPNFLAWGIIVVSSIMVLISFFEYIAAKKSNDTIKEKSPRLIARIVAFVKNEWKIIVFMALSVAYVLLYEQLGYFVMSFLVGTAILFLFNAKKKSYYVTTYAAIIVLYFAFRFILKAELPLGTWFGL